MVGCRLLQLFESRAWAQAENQRAKRVKNQGHELFALQSTPGLHQHATSRGHGGVGLLHAARRAQETRRLPSLSALVLAADASISCSWGIGFRGLGFMDLGFRGLGFRGIGFRGLEFEGFRV